MRKSYEWGPALLILSMITINAVEAAVLLSRHGTTQMYQAGTARVIPNGYTLDRQMSSTGPAPCYLLRVTKDSCPYCKQDAEHYFALAQRAVQIGCMSAMIAPKSGEMARVDDPQGTVQLEFVDMRFARAFNPFLTPQTIVLDADASIAWSSAGAMTEEIAREGMDVIANFSGRSSK